MRILIATDAWFPQTNGVVRTFSSTINVLEKMGHQVEVIHPDQFRTFPMPTYPEIRLAITDKKKIEKVFDEFKPEAVHIVAEGTIGLAVRNICLQRKLKFTTSYTTKYPEYVYARFYLPVDITYSLIRWFHAPSDAVMVATDSMIKELEEKNFKNLSKWTRGVDVELFNPDYQNIFDYPRPVMLYAGRLAVEKNIEAFLDVKTEGTKVIMGSGPDEDYLKRKYPDAVFVGKKTGEELAAHYASADVFVFPSLTDTFGLVMLEALASGVPVAAFPVTGPVDVIADSKTGILNNDLEYAIKEALKIPKDKCREYALNYSWEKVAKIFLDTLAVIK